MNTRSSFPFLAGPLAVFLLLAPAWAGTCPVPAGSSPALGELDAEARLRFLQQSLQHTARMERRFLLGWSGTYGVLAVGSYAPLVLANDPGARTEAYWNSATSAFAAVVAIIQPLLVLRDQRRLDALLGGERHGCPVLAQAERLLEHAAKSEAGARSAFAHVSSLAFNLALGLTLGYGLNRRDSAARNTTLGIIIGELMIRSRPTLAIRSLESYRLGDLRPPPAPPLFSLGLGAILQREVFGAAIVGTL